MEEGTTITFDGLGGKELDIKINEDDGKFAIEYTDDGQLEKFDEIYEQVFRFINDTRISVETGIGFTETDAYILDNHIDTKDTDAEKAEKIAKMDDILGKLTILGTIELEGITSKENPSSKNGKTLNLKSNCLNIDNLFKSNSTF